MMGGAGGDSDAAAAAGKIPPIGGAPAAILACCDDGRPSVILLASLQGTGKTTAAGKLALYLKEREVDSVAVALMSGDERSSTLASRMPKRNRRVLLCAADVYRPAAIEQLGILGTSIGVDVFSMGTDADPAEIARLAVEKAAAEGYDTVVVDTAGRQVVDEELMEELRRVKKAGEFVISFFFLSRTTPFFVSFPDEGSRGARLVSSLRLTPTSSFCFRHPHTPQTVRPDETLLVVDAMTGQAAASLTAAFDSAVGITGAILTKLDGDSRGGAAVSIRGVSGKPIKFVGVGERTQDLEPFYPDRMASRILGMGDVISLVEKAAMTVTDADAARMQEKMAKAEFDFDDFMAQSKLVSSMGSMAGVAKMLPGLGNMIDNSQLRMVEKRIKRSEAMICSMTKKERANPDLLLMDKSARSRVMRITKGCGLSFEDVS